MDHAPVAARECDPFGFHDQPKSSNRTFRAASIVAVTKPLSGHRHDPRDAR
jgi:hypothetical protein